MTQSTAISLALQETRRQLEKLHPESYEIYFEGSHKVEIDAREKKIESLTEAEDVGISVRLIHKKRLGFSFTTSLAPQAIEHMCRSAYEIAQVMPEDPYLGFNRFKTHRYPELKQFDQKGLDVPVHEKAELAKALEADCLKHDPRIKAVRSAAFSQVTAQSRMMDSEGSEIQESATFFSASVDCKSEQGTESQAGWDFDFSTSLADLSPKLVSERAASQALELLGAGTAPTMNCPAVFRNNVVTDLLGFLSGSFSIEAMEKGLSILGGKLGQDVFSPNVNLINDGLRPKGYGTCSFDGEGTPSQSTSLVSRGKFTQPLVDLYYAKKKGMKPTGSAFRSIKSPPSIGTSNFYLEPGQHSQDQMIASISKGILIIELMALHTANAVTGEFSLGASGILIENGKLTRPVRGFAVAGNVLDVFKRITDIGKDIRFFGKVGAPSIQVSEISVGGQ